jgi:acyl-CoA synthetase (AMP-forming)/AMP-acid ligase II
LPATLQVDGSATIDPRGRTAVAVRVSQLAERCPTLAHNLTARAERHGDRDAVSFTGGDGVWTTLTYRQLWQRAAAVAGLLRTARRRAGEPQFVVIVLPNGLDYVASFYGCLLAGAVGVPFFPPAILSARAARAFGQRIVQIARDCRPSVVILPRELIDQVRSVLDETGTGEAMLVAVEDLPTAADTDPGPLRIDARPDDLGLLQYTSGSTTTPKGVMVSHANLVHNVNGLAANLDSAEGESVTSWLPLFHDMGLIGKVLHPLSAGMTVHLTTPVAFVRRPLLWLDTISRSRSIMTMAPNFAYDLCVRWITEEQRESLDLSCLRHAVNAAEPVRLSTIEAFTKAYERHGFRPGAMRPAYGMAENTLCISIFDRLRDPVLREVSVERLRRDGVAVPARDEPATVLVGCGVDFTPDSETVIVDPQRLRACPDGTVGEIWVTGTSVAQGYWGLPELSEQTFAAELAGDGRRFLRTGDLGVKMGDELFIVGRIKDVIIQQGVNHYPQDVEYTAEQAHPAVQPSGTAVFTVRAGDDGERVVLVCELARYGEADPAAVLAAVRTAVTEEHGLELDTVALVRKGQIPKTTSGKIRRRASAQRWLDGEFETVAAWPAAAVPRRGGAA